MNYENYKHARDRAWQILIDCEIDRMPVAVDAITRHLGIHAHTYSKSKAIMQKLKLEKLAERTDGFCMRWNGEYHVFYNDILPVPRQRFTIAHEIGHIVLGHVPEGNYTLRNREPSAHDMPEETQANQFATRLLAPACVLHELRAFEPARIAELCNISITAATFRAERMKLLERRQKYYLSPLERAVKQRFQTFLDQMSSDN